MVSKTDELLWVIDLLNNHKISYWIDSGTLLGLYRDRKILDHDTDIDLGAWLEEEGSLKKIIPAFQRCGYKCRILNYNDYNFKYKFIPVDCDKTMTVDINVYCRNKAYSLCPQPTERTNFFIRAFLKLYRPIYKKYFSKVYFNRFPNNIIFQMDTWVIPNKYFDHFNYFQFGNIIIPDNVEDYLEFRYGNWQVEKKDWIFRRDDRGFRAIDIKELNPQIKG